MLRVLVFSMTIQLFAACVTPKLQTVSKAANPIPYRYERILVVAILPGQSDSLRDVVERNAVRELKAMGYDAVSYSNGFDIYEIDQTTTQEAAYFTLCDKGIDAVLTLANVGADRSVSMHSGSNATASFYFNHIWNYRQLSFTKSNISKKPRSWEAILFDLRSLEQQGVIQVTQLPRKGIDETTWVPQHVIQAMRNEQMLKPQLPSLPKKGF